jgi:radical SAM superfamily enzyme YgiQ (UPF0313 family)
MRILLINPPNAGRSIPEEEYGITAVKEIFRGEPLALEVIAGNLEGHEVAIVDLKVEPDALWKAYEHFKPEMIGLTGVTCEANSIIQLAEEIRKSYHPFIVVGGHHATCDPAFFNRSCIDFIVTGLGKMSFRELVDSLEQKRNAAGIPGVSITHPGRRLSFIKRTFTSADLVDGKAPRYDLVEKYRSSYVLTKLGMNLGFVVTAFGCTHRCAFCTIPPTTGGKYLTHQVDSVIRDIRLLGDIPMIRMVDANTFGNVAIAKQLCARIIQEGIRKRLLADIRPDTVVRYPGLIRKWKTAGLAHVIVGFEDIDDGTLQSYRKGIDVEASRKAIDILHEAGIAIVGDFIVSPDYGHEDFTRLERFIRENKIEIPILSILTPVPGTPLYKKMKNEIEIHDLDYYTFLNAVTPTRLDKKDFYQTFAELFMSFHKK